MLFSFKEMSNIFKTPQTDSANKSDSNSNLQTSNVSIFQEFCNVTTLHGFSFLSVFKIFWQKCLWSMIVVAAFGGVTFHLYYLVSTQIYSSYYILYFLVRRPVTCNI